MPELAWDPIVESLIGDRTQKPRATGVTMVIDTGVGLGLLRDTLELAGHCIDHWKLSFGTSVFLTKQILQRKLALLAEHEVLTFPGGTLLEVALVERHCRDYMKHAKTLGFSAVEISDGTIPMPAFRRRNIIHCALDAGLVPITEVGKKDPRQQPSAEQIAEQALEDLEHGARWVVVEGRESGRAVGIYRRARPGHRRRRGDNRPHHGYCDGSTCVGGPAQGAAGLFDPKVRYQRRTR